MESQEIERKVTRLDGDRSVIYQLVSTISIQHGCHRTRFDALDRKIDVTSAVLHEKIDTVAASLDAKIHGVEERLGARLDGMDGRLGGLDVSAEVLRRLPAA